MLTFDNIEKIKFEKNKFYCHKTPILLRDVNIEIVLVSNKISFDKKTYKYFIGYSQNNYKVNPLRIMLPKTTGYAKRYDGQTKWMNNIILFWIKSVLI